MSSGTLEITSRTAGTRFLELDSLRGIAALTVVFHHLRAALGTQNSWYLAPFIAGHAAVLLFFVLSGFVLSLPFWRKGHNDNYSKYLTRRFFRLYVPYLGALALAALGAKLFYGSRLPLGDWFYGTWQSRLTPSLIGQHLLMGGGSELNTAFWSLRYEMQMSIIFPLVLLAVRLLHPAGCAVIAAIVFVVGTGELNPHAPDPYLYLETLKYGSLFVVGAALARSLQSTRTWWDRMPKSFHRTILSGALFLYFGYADYLAGKLHHQAPEDLLVATGASALLLCAIYLAPFRSWLHGRVAKYLGRISYSMYLVHGTVLFALLNLLYSRVPVAVLGCIYVALTLALSHLFCITVEEPALRLGKRLTAHEWDQSFRTLWQRRPRITTAR